MLQRTILQDLKEAIESLEPPIAPSEKIIVYPNEPIELNDESDVYSQDVFFELFCGGISPIHETENSVVSNTVGSIVLNGKLNAGIAVLDRIADALVYLFSPTNPRRKNGFRIIDDRDNNTVDVYVSNVERSETGTDDGRFKCTIFITFDIYERR